MRQTSRPPCSRGAESASNSEIGAAIAPHIAQIAEAWIEIEGGIGYVEGGMTFLRIVIPLYLFV